MNWGTITNNDLKDAGHGAIIDTAQSTATGTDDPVAVTIADVIARIRAAIAPGNALDQDKTKIPNSLKDLAARMCVRRLKGRIEYPLTQDDRDQRKEDNDYLAQISKDKIRFETPDTPAGSAEMQEAGSMLEQQTGGNIDVPGGTPTRFNRQSTDGM